VRAGRALTRRRYWLVAARMGRSYRARVRAMIVVHSRANWTRLGMLRCRLRGGHRFRWYQRPDDPQFPGAFWEACERCRWQRPSDKWDWPTRPGAFRAG